MERCMGGANGVQRPCMALPMHVLSSCNHRFSQPPQALFTNLPGAERGDTGMRLPPPFCGCVWYRHTSPLSALPLRSRCPPGPTGTICLVLGAVTWVRFPYCCVP